MRLIFFYLTLMATMATASSGWSQSVSSGPSFNCNQKLSSIEESICADTTLSEIDRKLSMSYKLLKEASEDQSELKNIQSGWVMYRDAVCSKVDFGTRERHHCLKAMYQSRLYEISNELTGEVKQPAKSVVDRTPKEQQIETETGKKSVSSFAPYPIRIRTLQASLYKEGYFTDTGILRFKNASSDKSKARTISTYEEAISCVKKIKSSKTKIKKICKIDKDQDRSFSRLQPWFHIEWIDEEPSCVALRGRGLALSPVDERNLVIAKNSSDARKMNFSDNVLEVKIYDDIGQASTYSYDTDLDSAVIMRHNRDIIKYSKCMDFYEFKESGFP